MTSDDLTTPLPTRPPDWTTALAERLFGDHRHLPVLALLTALGEVLVAALVYVTGGTAYVYVHFMYLPVVFTGLIFGSRGGMLAAALGGLLLGPFMPLQVGEGLAQSPVNWLVRTVFFVATGFLAGGLGSLLKRRQRATEARGAAYARVLDALASLISERDLDTADHSQRVARNAVRLGLRPRQLEVLRWAAALHDLGKISVPEEVLHKPGPLTPAEWQVMRRHVAVGARVLHDASPDFAEIAQLVRAHHERLDGSGYPDGLQAEQLPLGARILGALDVFEAMTAARPYRPQPHTPAQALAHLRQESGRLYDPQVVAAIQDLYSRGQLSTAGESTLP